MDAMILAAGLGTRLRPFTDHMPKALIDVGGETMLERVARRLIDAGATRLIINTHHFAEQIEQFVLEHEGFGVEVHISNEPGAPLDTGGGILHAARYFRRDAPFFLHNADIFSDCDLRMLYQANLRNTPLATLAMMERETTRHLIFDETGGLCGYSNSATGLQRLARQPVGEIVRIAFSGIHVISPRIFDLIQEQGAFSIIDLYLRLAANGERIEPFDITGATWIDIGKPEQLQRARGRGVSS